MWFGLSPGDYYTFAISFASGLSKYGKKIMFEINNAMIKNSNAIDAVRGIFNVLMDNLSSKMSTKKVILDNKQSNIFRQVHCNVKYEKDNTALSIVFLVHLANYADRLHCPLSTKLVGKK